MFGCNFTLFHSAVRNTESSLGHGLVATAAPAAAAAKRPTSSLGHGLVATNIG